MANDNLSSDPLHLEPLDLNNLDDFLGDSNQEKEGVVKRFTTGFKRGFLQQTKIKTITRSFLRTALPDGYSRGIGVLDDTQQTLKSIGYDLESSHYNELDTILSSVQEQLPRLKTRTSSKLYEKLEKSLKERREAYAFSREMNRDREQVQKERQTAQDEALIREALDGSDSLAVELAVAREEAETERFMHDNEMQGLRDRVSKDRFDVMSRALSSIVVSQQKQVAFQDQITYRYQRKGLELQFRSFMALRDIRKMAEVQLKLHKDAYTALVTNTGLPDHLKSTKAERARFNGTGRAGQRGSNRVYSSLPMLLAGFAPSMAENAKGLAGGAISQLAELLGEGEGMGSLLYQQFQNDKAGFTGDMAGRASSLAMQRLLIPMLARRTRPELTRLSDKHLQGRHNQLSYLFDNAPSVLQDYANDHTKSEGLSGMLQSAIRAIVPQFALNDRVTTGNYQTIGNQVAFNQLTQRSIVEVIPGYLARILHETRMLRTGSDSVDMEVYDVTRGEFTTRATAQTRLQSRIVKGRDSKNVSWAINEALNTYDEEGQLSPEARHALAERLLRDASTNKRFSAEAYASTEGYAPETDDQVIRELNQFFKGKFRLDEQGKLVATAENFAEQQRFSQSFLDIRNMTSDPIKEINRLLETGNIGALREIGIVVTVEGVDQINYNRLWELYRQGVTDTNPNPGNPLGDAGGPDTGNGGGSGEGSGGGALNGLRAQFNRARTLLQDQVAQASGRLPGGFAGPLGLPSPLPRPDEAIWQQRAQDVANRLQNKVMPQVNQVIDVLVEGTDKVAFTAQEITEGRLIDVSTQKVIESITDITGPVIDEEGKLRLTRTDIQKGLTDSIGQKLTLPLALASFGLPSIRGMITGIRNRLTRSQTDEDGYLNRIKDVYIEHAKEPVLLARDMVKGKYLDLNSQKVIESVDDITGAVADSSTQEILVTEEEVRQGLFDMNGFKLRLPKAIRALMNIGWFASRPLLLAARTGLWAGRKILSMTLNRFTTRDAYLPGVKEPVLSARKLKRGEYFDGEGSPLSSFDDLRNGVFDEQGEVIVSEEDVPKLVNRDGSKHTAAKRRSVIRRLGKQALKWAGRKYWGATKRYYNWLGDSMDKPFNTKINPETGEREEVVDPSKLNTPTDSLLGKILTTLNNRLPSEGPRKGSWQDQLAQEEAADAAQSEADKEKRANRRDRGNGMMAGLMSFLRGEKGREEESEEDDGGGDIYIDNNGEERTRRPRPDRPDRPKGRFGRMMDRVKASRTGRVLGGLGRGAAWLGRGALALGTGGLIGASGVATAASAVGSGLLAAGGILASVVTSPVTLGAAAVGLAGYGAYKLYTRNRDTSGDFRELRLLQYGIDSTGLGLKVLSIESVLETVTLKAKEPDWSFNKEIADKVLDIMGLDKEDHEEVLRLGKWLDHRFKPVFFSYISAMHQLGQDSVPINEIDDKVSDDLKFSLLELSKLPFGTEGPYGVVESPDGDEDPLEVTPSEIKEKYEELKAKYKELAKSEEGRVTTPGEGTVPSTAAKATAAGVATAVTGAKVIPITQQARDTVNAQPRTGTTGGNQAGYVGAMVVAFAKFDADAVSSLQAIRLRAYGLGVIDKATARALLNAESIMYSMISFDNNGQAKLAQGTHSLFVKAAPLFGTSMDEEMTTAKMRFVNWMHKRFMPGFMAFITAVKQVNPALNNLNAVESLSAADQLHVAKALMAAVAQDGRRNRSIWESAAIPWDGNTSLDGIKALAEQELKVLEEKAKKETVATPTQSAREQQAKASSNAVTTGADVNQSAGFFSRATDAIRNFSAGISTGLGNAWKGVKDFFGFGEQAPIKPYDPATTPTFGGPLAAQGNVYQGFAKGTGGAFEQIPLPATNKSREAAMPTLKAIEAMTGVDAELLATFCSIESGFNYLIKAPTSSATGWFQFINATWDEQLKKHGSKYGIPPDDAQRSLRRDPRINGLMGAEFLKGNYQYMISRIGRAPTDVDLYCAHFFGPGTAVKFLNMDPNSFAALALPAQARANTSIFYKAPGAPRTVREVYQLFEEKVAKHRKGGGRNILLQQPANDDNYVDVAQAQADAVAQGGTQTDTPDPSTQPTQGGNTQQSPALGTTSLSEQVSKTVATPLSMPATAQPGGSVSSGAKPADETIDEPSVGDDAQTTAAKAAAKADKMKQAQVNEHMTQVKTATDLQAQQLAVQAEMRDYLKEIAQNMGVTGFASKPAANAMEKPSAETPARRPGQSRGPVNMSR